MTSPQLRHETRKVRDLISEFQTGKLMIPEFQRGFVWPPKKAAGLLDSLFQNYPISSLLVWDSPDDVRSRSTAKPGRQRHQTAWLIDGQQRVTTLTRILEREIDIVFNVANGTFQQQSAATKKDPDCIPVAELWDDELYLTHRRNFELRSRSRQIEERCESVRKVLNYEVPIVRMMEHSFDSAVSAFERINTQGIKLKRQDVEAAKVAAKHTGFIVDSVGPYLRELHDQGYSRLNIMHLFRVCAFIAKPDGRNRTPLHELDRKTLSTAWKRTERATQQALALVRSELGLVNMDILFSGALLVPVIALCDVLGPRERNAAELIAWLALAALSHRYSGTVETKLDEDLRACRSDNPIGGLLRNLRQGSASLRASASNFDGRLADRSGLLALYIACKHRGVVDLFSGAKIIMQRHIDRHHILPRAQFDEQYRKEADTLANIAFVTDEANRSVGMSAPQIYLSNLSNKTLKSQCIPLDSSLWDIDSSDAFWAARRELLAEAFNEFVVEALPGRKL